MSSLKQTLRLAGPILPGNPGASTPQFTGSDVTSYVGGMFVDIQDTTIQLMPGASIRASIGAPGAGSVPGLYAPFDPVVTAPSSMTPGLNPNSNYGFSIGAAGLGLKLVQHRLEMDNGDSLRGLPSTPMQLAGTYFNLFGQAMSFSAGREASCWELLPTENETRSLAGGTFVLFGTDNTDIGTWDGITLTLPVHSVHSFLVSNELGGITQIVYVEGQLVFEPVPEPSSLTILSVALVGLLSYAWIARRRAESSVDSWIGET